MSPPERRRNGSQASCEPCRKGKMRCDHQKPICAPCHRRGRESLCFYHPAPLTRPRASRESRPRPSTLNPTPTPSDDSTQSIRNEDNSSQLGDSRTTTLSAESTPKTHSWSFIYNEHPDSNLSSQLLGPDNQRNREDHLAALREIASPLEHFSQIEKLVDEYFSLTQAAIVPHPIVSQLFTLLKSSLLNSKQREDNPEAPKTACDISKLATSLLRSSSHVVTVTPSQDLEAFCALFSGASLRIETLGLMYTIAARSYLYATRRDDKRLQDFARQLIRCSDLSLRLSHELAAQNTNDLIVWLGLENVQLTALLEGHGSAYTRAI